MKQAVRPPGLARRILHLQGHGAVILPLVAVFMTIVGLAAAYGPARRGLQIQPVEALREE